ncbi:efflux RND transporter permease subunit, partial [Arthrospira platensis SPKY1]|nr:efflux RND transporter permease subunit [Arthrospira platensis SPKY1]
MKDVAELSVGAAVPMGSASRNASPAVIMAISKQPNVNTVELTGRIEQVLEEFRSALPADVEFDTAIFRQADFIETAVNNVQTALIEGAIFVVIILLFFLGSYR